jgi:hypothetical protein
MEVMSMSEKDESKTLRGYLRYFIEELRAFIGFEENIDEYFKEQDLEIDLHLSIKATTKN